jgi:hypothetical protein
VKQKSLMLGFTLVNCTEDACFWLLGLDSWVRNLSSQEKECQVTWVSLCVGHYSFLTWAESKGNSLWGILLSKEREGELCGICV